MSSPLVLLTGGSGHLGFRVLVTALEAGFSVRAAIRSSSKAKAILAAPSIVALSPGKKLEFAIVEDILAVGAYDEALKGATYVIHCASPLAGTSDDYERDIIQPAVKGTVGILRSAMNVPSVKRLVITSTVLTAIPFSVLVGPETDQVFKPEEVPFPNPTGPYGHPFQAYQASKILALMAITKFVETEKPSFDVVNVMPGYIIGKNELVTDPKNILSGTNANAFRQILGHKTDQPDAGVTVFVNDVAKVHVLALDSKIKGNQNFGASQASVWDDATEIVKRRFPEAVKDGRLPSDGIAPTKKMNYDASRTEEVFGFKFADFETQVVSVTEHYLELLDKAGAKA